MVSAGTAFRSNVELNFEHMVGYARAAALAVAGQWLGSGVQTYGPCWRLDVGPMGLPAAASRGA